MRIVMLDFMPVLWGICAAAALLLLLRGEWGAPARTIPAVCAALVLYFAAYPPRVQVLAFAGMYVCAALAWWIVTRVVRLRRRRAEAKQMQKNEECSSL